MIGWARSVHVSPAVEEYAVALAQATRNDPSLHLGASPRATLQLVRAAKVLAALDGREFVIPDDLAALIVPVFAHRLLPARGVHRAGAQPVEAALRQIVDRVRVPLTARA
jgi:MoxR-like ATPase